MYKILIIFVFISLGYVRSAQKTIQLEPEKAAKLLQICIQCISETGADPNLLVQLMDRKYTDNDEVKRFFLCAFKKNGVATKKGVIKVDEMLKVFPDSVNKEELRAVIDGCNKDNGIEPKEKIFSFFKCFEEKTPVRVTL